MTVDRSTYEWDFIAGRERADFLRSPLLMQFYKEWVKEETVGDPQLPENIRKVSLQILNEEDEIHILRSALVALSAVGKQDDIPTIEKLSSGQNEKLLPSNEDVSARAELLVDVKTCIYEILHR